MCCQWLATRHCCAPAWLTCCHPGKCRCWARALCTARLRDTPTSRLDWSTRERLGGAFFLFGQNGLLPPSNVACARSGVGRDPAKLRLPACCCLPLRPPAQALRVPPDHHHHPVRADRCAWMGSGGRHACSHDCGIGSVSCAALKCLSSLPPRTNIACSGPQGPAVEPPEDSHQPARPHVRRPAAVAPAPLLGLKQAGIDPFCSRLLSSAPFEYLFRVLRSSCSRAALPVFRPSCQQPTHALARPLYCFVLLPDKHHMPMP